MQRFWGYLHANWFGKFRRPLSKVEPFSAVAICRECFLLFSLSPRGAFCSVNHSLINRLMILLTVAENKHRVNQRNKSKVERIGKRLKDPSDSEASELLKGKLKLITKVFKKSKQTFSRGRVWNLIRLGCHLWLRYTHTLMGFRYAWRSTSRILYVDPSWS